MSSSYDSVCRAGDSGQPARASVSMRKTRAITLQAQAYTTCQTPNGILTPQMRRKKRRAHRQRNYFSRKNKTNKPGVR